VRPDHRLPLSELEPYCLPNPPAGSQPPIDWQQLFGNANPIEIEVGFGKGLFLLSESEKRPKTNFFGIEIVRKLQLYVATRLAIRERRNVRVACTDARALLKERVAANSVQGVYVFFPDPWWKSRHKKRRVFTPEFAVTCSRILFPGGRLNIVTDVEEYFGVMTDLVRPMPQFAELPPPSESVPEHQMDYLTNFERKFRLQGKPIYRASFERTDTAAAEYHEVGED
jgi:tRNA (guanine-N7-)-methyltransferase